MLPEGTTEALHGRRMSLVRREACAVAAQKLKLDQLLVVGRGYEGQVPTMHMLAGEAEALQGTVAGIGMAAQAGAACSNRRRRAHWPAISHMMCLLCAEAFEAIWGAIYADDGFRMQRVKEIYASLYPLAVATAPAS